MDSTRMQKVSRLVQKELGEYFQRHAGSNFNGRMITVTVVRMSPDLALAKIYLSIFPSEHKEEVMKLVNAHNKSIRNDLAQKIRNQVRIIPELAFFIDDSMDYFENIDGLLKKK
jgi:ribosome-binding factor A